MVQKHFDGVMGGRQINLRANPHHGKELLAALISLMGRQNHDVVFFKK